MHIRVDDMVEIRGGREKGLRAKVLRVLHDDGKVVVEGVNRVFKHMRKSQKNPRGGRLQKEMPVPASVVQLVCPACGEAARTGVRFKDDGSKNRYCKSCSAEIGQISPAKKGRPQARRA